MRRELGDLDAVLLRDALDLVAVVLRGRGLVEVEEPPVPGRDLDAGIADLAGPPGDRGPGIERRRIPRELREEQARPLDRLHESSSLSCFASFLGTGRPRAQARRRLRTNLVTEHNRSGIVAKKQAKSPRAVIHAIRYGRSTCVPAAVLRRSPQHQHPARQPGRRRPPPLRRRRALRLVGHRAVAVPGPRHRRLQVPGRHRLELGAPGRHRLRLHQGDRGRRPHRRPLPRQLGGRPCRRDAARRLPLLLLLPAGARAGGVVHQPRAARTRPPCPRSSTSSGPTSRRPAPSVPTRPACSRRRGSSSRR